MTQSEEEREMDREIADMQKRIDEGFELFFMLEKEFYMHINFVMRVLEGVEPYPLKPPPRRFYFSKSSVRLRRKHEPK